MNFLTDFVNEIPKIYASIKDDSFNVTFATYNLFLRDPVFGVSINLFTFKKTIAASTIIMCNPNIEFLPIEVKRELKPFPMMLINKYDIEDDGGDNPIGTILDSNKKPNFEIKTYFTPPHKDIIESQLDSSKDQKMLYQVSFGMEELKEKSKADISDRCYFSEKAQCPVKPFKDAGQFSRDMKEYATFIDDCLTEIYSTLTTSDEILSSPHYVS